MPLFLELALSYLRYKSKESSIRLMLRMCFAGIFVGTAALMITCMIMTGFEKEILKKIKSIQPDLTVSCPGKRIDGKSMRLHLLKEMGTFITAISCISSRQVLCEYDDQHSVLFLTGIEPEHEERMEGISTKIVAQEEGKDFVHLFGGMSIIIGKSFAERNGIQLGDELTLLLARPKRENNLSLKPKKVRVSGIFSVGLDEYDTHCAYMSLEDVDSLWKQTDGGVDQVHVQCSKNLMLAAQESRVPYLPGWIRKSLFALFPMLSGSIEKEAVSSHLSSSSCKIVTWKERYPALISSLRLEKYVMFFVLALILMVASMNMISVIFMQTQQKRRDVAVLLSMGMPPSQVRLIFFSMGCVVTIAAATLAMICAAGVGWLLQTYPFIELPDVYYVSHLPVYMSVDLFLMVYLFILSVGAVSSYLPARSISRLQITGVLRHE